MLSGSDGVGMNARLERPVVRTASRAAGIGGFLGGIVVGGLAGALVGWVAARGEIRHAEDARALAVAEAEGVVAGLRGELASARARQAILRARLAAGAALEELDARNFGNANQHLAQAAMALASVDRTVLANGGEVEALAREVDLARTEVPMDAGAQRERVATIVARLEALSEKGRDHEG